MRVLSLFFVICCGALVAGQPSNAHSKERFPSCTSENVLERLVSRFNKTERIYWSHRGKVLAGIDGAHQHSENSFPGSPVNRRYCHGDAIFADGKTRRIHYRIEQDSGFAGFDWRIGYCIHGLDPWKYNDGRCRVFGAH